MDDSGRICRSCKCGEVVYYDQDCPKCGEKSDTAEVVSKMLGDAIRDEVPDPLGELRKQLLKNYQREMRKKADAEPDDSRLSEFRSLLNRLRVAAQDEGQDEGRTECREGESDER